MTTTYKTPGVYFNLNVERPIEVGEVATSIPAIIGYTEKAVGLDGENLVLVPTRITSMAEYEQYFGGEADHSETSGSFSNPKVILNPDKSVNDIKIQKDFHLYYSMKSYFANGGASCYIVSIGGYDSTIGTTGFLKALNKIQLEDEPTLLASPDAILLNDTDLGTVQKAMLAQCNKLQDRFCVFDLKESTTGDLGESAFRSNIGTQYLNYGAAYGPWIETEFRYDLYLEDLNIVRLNNDGIEEPYTLEASSLTAVHQELEDDIQSILNSVPAGIESTFDTPVGSSTALKTKFSEVKTFISDIRTLITKVSNRNLLNTVSAAIESGSDLESVSRSFMSYDLGYIPSSTPPPTSPLEAFEVGDLDGEDIDPSDLTDTWIPVGKSLSDYDYDLSSVILDSDIYVGTTVGERIEAASVTFAELVDQLLGIVNGLVESGITMLHQVDNSIATADSVYGGIQNAIGNIGIVVPPSLPILGVYNTTDVQRGVWKAPANVELKEVIKPTIKVNNSMQENLNVDPTSGKSINVIRAFTGKGVVVWGSRTLAGNDNEWRYVPVRRLFINIEESIKKVMESVVFEANNSPTWERTRVLIDDFLKNLWEAGAFAGGTRSEAYSIKIGLGESMTQDDILEGRMIVDIGVAAARPAEFIVLRFTQKLEQS